MEPAPEIAVEVPSQIDPMSEMVTFDEHNWGYTQETWKYMVEQEDAKPKIYLQSPQLKFRGTLVRHLREASKTLGYGTATLHSAISLLDLFMDAHILRGDRLTHVALVCLSLAAKSEEKFNQPLTFKVVSQILGMRICMKTFRQLEWMVGQHARWRLLAPNTATFASLLAPFVVVESDLAVKNPETLKKMKREGRKLLDSYLDITLTDYRLKLVKSVSVACACVASARADLGLTPWPTWMVGLTGLDVGLVTCLTSMLKRIVDTWKSIELERSDPNRKSKKAKEQQSQPSDPYLVVTSTFDPIPLCTTQSACVYTTAAINPNSPERPINKVMGYWNTATAFVTPPNQPTLVMIPERIANPPDCRYTKPIRLIEPNLGNVNQTAANKRRLDLDVEAELAVDLSVKVPRFHADHTYVQQH